MDPMQRNVKNTKVFDNSFLMKYVSIVLIDRMLITIATSAARIASAKTEFRKTKELFLAFNSMFVKVVWTYKPQIWVFQPFTLINKTHNASRRDEKLKFYIKIKILKQNFKFLKQKLK